MKPSAQPSTPMLRWVFRRQHHAITCEIDARGDRTFEVCLVPHWDVSASTIERFDAVHRALERHAELALRLRDAGWRRARPGPHHPCVAAA